MKNQIEQIIKLVNSRTPYSANKVHYPGIHSEPEDFDIAVTDINNEVHDCTSKDDFNLLFNQIKDYLSKEDEEIYKDAFYALFDSELMEDPPNDQELDIADHQGLSF